MRTLVALLLLISTEAAADFASRETAWQLLNMADMSQTLQIATDCRSDSPEHFEANRNLGRCPDHAQVRLWFFGTSLLHYLIADAMPEPMARGFQWGTIIYTGNAVKHNIHFGLAVKF